MEEWNVLVRNLGDEYENSKVFHDCAKAIFSRLCSKKIKDQKKFEQRLGPEYEQFVEDLNCSDLLNNDEFFTLTLELTKKFKK